MFPGGYSRPGSSANTASYIASSEDRSFRSSARRATAEYFGSSIHSPRIANCTARAFVHSAKSPLAAAARIVSRGGGAPARFNATPAAAAPPFGLGGIGRGQRGPPATTRCVVSTSALRTRRNSSFSTSHASPYFSATATIGQLYSNSSYRPFAPSRTSALQPP